mgnify:CR=1 FL=1
MVTKFALNPTDTSISQIPEMISDFLEKGLKLGDEKMNSLKSIHNYLKELSCIKFILVMTLFTYLLILPFVVVFVLFGYTDIGGPSSLNSLSYTELIVVVLIVPII